MELVRYTASEDWSALYVDGKLDIVGDHYLIDERISHLAGVDSRSSEAFLQGGNQYEDVAQTLTEAEAYERVLKEDERNTAELLAEATRMEEAAKALRAKANSVR